MKDKNVALILSVIFGMLGIDRFYLGYPLIGLIKLLTFGCFGVLWIADIICIALGKLKPNNGEYSAESIQSCSDGAKSMLKGFASMAADKAAEQGNSMGAYLANRIANAAEDGSGKKDEQNFATDFYNSKKETSIASAIMRGPYAMAFDEKGNKLFSVAADQILGFTSTSVTVKVNTWAITYDQKGNKLYSNSL